MKFTSMSDETSTGDSIESLCEYLDDLRESGATNMFGAPRFLESDFGLSHKEATDVFEFWIEHGAHAA